MPIGVYDSGVGGLSVLRHLRADLPGENFVYFADAAYAPYGELDEATIRERCIATTEFLLAHGIKMLVVACNTATAAGIELLRTRYPHLPLIGVEPGLKPAALNSTTGVVGVLATKATLTSQRFQTLQAQIVDTVGTRFILQGCAGLADQIERGELLTSATAVVLRRHLEPILAEGADTIVLGCTHYPFVTTLIERLIAQIAPGRTISLIDTGAPVSRQVLRKLTEKGLVNKVPGATLLDVFTTGSRTQIESAFQRLLATSIAAKQIVAHRVSA